MGWPDCFYLKNPKKYFHPGHWVVTNQNIYSDYSSLKIILDNAIYSPSGKWGVMISHEDFAVIGADITFIKRFKQCYPNWEEEKLKFIRRCNDLSNQNPNLEWLAAFLKHMHFSN
jgi:hypothetical protein